MSAGDTGRSPADGAEQHRTELLERACAGDPGALHEVVAELTPLLWHVARGQGLDREAAADAVQTTWASLLPQLEGIRSPSALVGWLVTTTRRTAWKARDGQRREVSVEPADLVDSVGPAGRPGADSGPEAAVLDRERARRLWQHVQKLPLRCRQLLRVVAFTDRPDYDAVSEWLGMPRGSIGPTRGRCLAKLRGLLADDPAWSD